RRRRTRPGGNQVDPGETTMQPQSGYRTARAGIADPEDPPAAKWLALDGPAGVAEFAFDVLPRGIDPADPIARAGRKEFDVMPQPGRIVANGRWTVRHRPPPRQRHGLSWYAWNSPRSWVPIPDGG